MDIYVSLYIPWRWLLYSHVLCKCDNEIYYILVYWDVESLSVSVYSFSIFFPDIAFSIFSIKRIVLSKLN